jgi:LysR family transcriptional regulator of gallate degradation
MELAEFNLRHMRAALETARRGSLSAAARDVALTQPAASQGIARLEALLGVRLFERVANGMVPTPAMQLIAPRIEAALAHLASPRVTMAQLHCFIALAGAGSYAGASRVTGLAEPTIHRAVRDLSVSLRRRLVERRGRGVTLSETGRRTARAFRLARAELAAALSDIAADAGREIGRIVIGAMPLSRARLLPDAAAAFHAAHPEMGLGIVEGSFAELIEPLRNGEIDVILGALRDPSLCEGLAQQALFTDHLVVLSRAGHGLAGTHPGLSELAAYPWVLPASGTPLRRQWEQIFTGREGGLPRVPIECGSAVAIREILLQTDFLTLLSPDQVSVELQAGVLCAICTPPGNPARSIGYTTRAFWRPTRLQAAFLACLEQAAEAIARRGRALQT